MTTKFEEYKQRKEHEYGERFDPSHLSSKFVRYFNSGERIKVRTIFGETLTGTIGVTTGWRPVFLLMRSVRAHGSSVTNAVFGKYAGGRGS